MAIRIETASAEMSSEKLLGYIDEGIKQVLSWIEREKASTETAVSGELIRSLIKIYLSQNNLLSSSAREPEGRVRLIYQAIYDDLCPKKQNKKKKREEPTKKTFLGRKIAFL